MATAKEKAAQAAAEKEAAEQAAVEQAAVAEKEAGEQAAKEAAEKEAEEKAAREAEEQAAALAAKKAEENAPSGVMKVFCKLPSGMTFAMPGGDVVLSGASSSTLFNGYGVTFLTAAAWEALEARYGKMDVFRKKIIFAEENIQDGVAVTKEMSGEKTGFEGVDPKNPGKDLEPGSK